MAGFAPRDEQFVGVNVKSDFDDALGVADLILSRLENIRIYTYCLIAIGVREYGKQTIE